MTKTLVNGYSSKSTQWELSNEYQLDRSKMVIIIVPFFVHWTKVTPAAEGLKPHSSLQHQNTHFDGKINTWHITLYQSHNVPLNVGNDQPSYLE